MKKIDYIKYKWYNGNDNDNECKKYNGNDNDEYNGKIGYIKL